MISYQERGRWSYNRHGGMEQGLIEGGLPRERIETHFAEPDAMARALGMMQDGDLVVVLAENVGAVLHRVRSRTSG